MQFNTALFRVFKTQDLNDILTEKNIVPRNAQAKHDSMHIVSIFSTPYGVQW